MTEFLDWKVLDQSQVQVLETEHDMDNLRRYMQHSSLKKWLNVTNCSCGEDYMIILWLLRIFAVRHISVNWRSSWKFLLTIKGSEKLPWIFTSTTTCKIDDLAFLFEPKNCCIIFSESPSKTCINSDSARSRHLIIVARRHLCLSWQRHWNAMRQHILQLTPVQSAFKDSRDWFWSTVFKDRPKGMSVYLSDRRICKSVHLKLHYFKI